MRRQGHAAGTVDPVLFFILFADIVIIDIAFQPVKNGTGDPECVCIEQHKTDLHTEDEQWLMHSVSCRAAIKAGHRTSEMDMLAIAEKIIKNEIPEFCPHGRPVVFAVTKNDLEKGFGRIR